MDELLCELELRLGSEDYDHAFLMSYLLLAKSKILNRRYPFGYEKDTELEHQYNNLCVELAIVLINERGVEGQSSHSENGVARHYRTENEILAEITPMANAL